MFNHADIGSSQGIAKINEFTEGHQTADDRINF